MKSLTQLISLASLLALPALVSAQSVWTNAAADFSFSNPANWAGNAVPASGADLSLAISDLVGLDNGGNFAANSLTIQSGISGMFVSASAETLTLGAGGISNLGLGVDFQSTLLTTATQTWNVGDGTFTIGNTFDVTTGSTLTINVGSGATFLFAMGQPNPDWNGFINFVGSVSTASLRVTGAGFTTQNLSRITIDGAEAQLVGDQLSAVSAIPEPSTYAMMAGVAALVLAAARRKFSRPVVQS
ncbi:PEP-CTERM sorting domain-containing protein [Oleiharenicola lentus]|uniref:PEP-CTERM sorting domain-containing protein n=1 Tax=Oleiharenicola lentus TaxID=2508720 RepID=UPI003F676A0B